MSLIFKILRKPLRVILIYNAAKITHTKKQTNYNKQTTQSVKTATNRQRTVINHFPAAPERYESHIARGSMSFLHCNTKANLSKFSPGTKYLKRVRQSLERVRSESESLHTQDVMYDGNFPVRAL